MPTRNDLFVDTAGWAYYFDRRDPLHPAVVALVQDAVKGQRHLITTNYIFTELVALLSHRHYRLPRQEVIMAMNAIKTDTTVEIVYIDQALHDEAWALLEARAD